MRRSGSTADRDADAEVPRQRPCSRLPGRDPAVPGPRRAAARGPAQLARQRPPRGRRLGAVRRAGRGRPRGARARRHAAHRPLPRLGAEEERDGYRVLRAGGRLRRLPPRAAAAAARGRAGRSTSSSTCRTACRSVPARRPRAPSSCCATTSTASSGASPSAARRPAGRPPGSAGRWSRGSRPAVYRGCRYVTVSEVSRDDLVGLGRAARRRAPWCTTAPRPRARTGPRSAVPEVVVLGRLVPHKRVEHAVRAVAALRRRAAGAAAHRRRAGLVGRRAARPRSRALGVRRPRRPARLGRRRAQAARCSAAPGCWRCRRSRRAGGCASVEAAAHGTPAVAYRDAGGVAESVVDGVTGLLCDDEQGLTEPLRRLLIDDALRARTGAAAVAHSARYTWAATTDAFEAVLLQAVGRRPVGPAPLRVPPPRPEPARALATLRQGRRRPPGSGCPGDDPAPVAARGAAGERDRAAPPPPGPPARRAASSSRRSGPSSWAPSAWPSSPSCATATGWGRPCRRWGRPARTGRGRRAGRRAGQRRGLALLPRGGGRGAARPAGGAPASSPSPSSASTCPGAAWPYVAQVREARAPRRRPGPHRLRAAVFLAAARRQRRGRRRASRCRCPGAPGPRRALGWLLVLAAAALVCLLPPVLGPPARPAAGRRPAARLPRLLGPRRRCGWRPDLGCCTAWRWRCSWSPPAAWTPRALSPRPAPSPWPGPRAARRLAPAGAGVREVVLVAALSAPSSTGGAALAVALVSRALLTAADLALPLLAALPRAAPGGGGAVGDPGRALRGAWVAGAHGLRRVLLPANAGAGAPVPRARHLRSLLDVHDPDALLRADLPWWTYRATDVVDAFLLGRGGRARAFEYGSGASTVWLARRCAEVASVEHVPGWADAVRGAWRRTPTPACTSCPPCRRPGPERGAQRPPRGRRARLLRLRRRGRPGRRAVRPRRRGRPRPDGVPGGRAAPPRRGRDRRLRQHPTRPLRRRAGRLPAARSAASAARRPGCPTPTRRSVLGGPRRAPGGRGASC